MMAVKDITKRFGSTLALDSVTLEFSGRVNLVLGTNGSGKSTLINIIAGVTYPQGGTLLLNGVELHSRNRRAWRQGIEVARTKMGFMLDKPGYPTYLEGAELLEWASETTDGAWTTNLSQRLDMGAFLNRTIGGYSSGMTQKLGLASSVVTKPEFVLWDEPTANLDAPTRRAVATLIGELSGKGTAFIIASHTPTDFEGIADWMCVMRLGRVVKSGMIRDLSVDSARLIIESDQPSLLSAEALRAGLATGVEVRGETTELEASGAVDAAAVRKLAASVHVQIRSMEVKPKTVRELYAEAIA